MKKVIGYILVIGGSFVLLLDAYLYLSGKAGKVPFLSGLLGCTLGVLLIKKR